MQRRTRQVNGGAEQLKRDLKIKTSAVQRLSKELELYEKERNDQASKVEQLRSDGAESHDIKRAEDLLAEASMMVPDTKQRLAAALENLNTVEEDAADSLTETEEWQKATSTIGHAKQLLAV